MRGRQPHPALPRGDAAIIGTAGIGVVARDHRWLGRPGIDWVTNGQDSWTWSGSPRSAISISAGRRYGPPSRRCSVQVAELADVLALCGDLTDRGDPEEAPARAKALASVGVPIVAVLGNHDYESAKVPELTPDPVRRGRPGARRRRRGRGPRRRVRRGEGIRRRVRPPRARAPGVRRLIKLFVREAVDEALKLETSLEQAANGPARGPAALLPDRRHGGGRAAGDLPLPRLEPTGGAADPLPGGRGVPRARASRDAGGEDGGRGEGLQRVAVAAAAELSGSAALSRGGAADGAARGREVERRQERRATEGGAAAGAAGDGSAADRRSARGPMST